MFLNFKKRGQDVENPAQEGLLQNEKLDGKDIATSSPALLQIIPYRSLTVAVLVHLTLIAIYTFVFFALQDHQVERISTRGSAIYCESDTYLLE